MLKAMVQLHPGSISQESRDKSQEPEKDRNCELLVWLLSLDSCHSAFHRLLVQWHDIWFATRPVFRELKDTGVQLPGGPLIRPNPGILCGLAIMAAFNNNAIDFDLRIIATLDIDLCIPFSFNKREPRP